MEMRAGCRLLRSGLFPLNLNLNLGRRSRSLGRAEGSGEGLGAGPPQAPGTHPRGWGVPGHPAAFVPWPGGSCRLGSQRGLLSSEQNAGKPRRSSVSAVPVSTGLPGMRLQAAPSPRARVVS